MLSVSSMSVDNQALAMTISLRLLYYAYKNISTEILTGDIKPNPSSMPVQSSDSPSLNHI
jgi:hypothetical protein